jgi:hypothetical protein
MCVCVCVFYDYFLHRCDWMNCSEISLLIYGLFNDAISSCDYTSLYRMVWLVNSELQRMWKDCRFLLGSLYFDLPVGLRKLTILSKYSSLQDLRSPTTQREYKLFRLELERARMEDKNAIHVLTKRFRRCLVDWVKAANKKLYASSALRDSNPGLLTIRSVFLCPKQSLLTYRVVFWDLP